jgi:hypothetical protein
MVPWDGYPRISRDPRWPIISSLYLDEVARKYPEKKKEKYEVRYCQYNNIVQWFKSIGPALRSWIVEDGQP